MTTITSGIAKAIGILASLISVPLTYRYLGPERYGIWMVLISIITAMSFADLGIGNGLMNAVSEAYGKDDRRLAQEHVTSALALMLLIGFIFAVAGAVGYQLVPWPRLLNVKSPAAAAEGARAFLVLYASFVVNLPLGVIARAQAGLQKAYTAQIVNAAGSMLSLSAILVVVWLSGSLVWLVFAFVSTATAATLLNGWLLFREFPWLLPARHAFSSAAARKIFDLGILFFVLQCAFVLSYTSDNVVIAQVLGVAAVAVYAVPQKLFSSISTVVSMAINPLWPAYGEAISRGDVAWVRRTFFASLFAILAFTIPVCIVLVLLGPFILRAAVGKSFHAPLGLLIVLAVWAVTWALTTAVTAFLNGAGVLKEQAGIVVIASICNLGLSIYLTIHLGVIGVCLGSILTQLFIISPAYFFLVRGLLRRTATLKMNEEVRQTVSFV
jgi:O-antigen/teichoic acid export membrane protein